MRPDLEQLIEMLTYRRPEGSYTQLAFCERFLEPVFGLPDAFGNYVVQVGEEKSPIAFMAHHDTVHKAEGRQKLQIVGDIVALAEQSDSNCLGADCTTGVWLILHMIRAGVPGRYVVHAGEESGGVGAHQLLKTAAWVKATEVALSFDRFGQKSIITHQCGYRTCSDAFAGSLAAILGMGHELDDTGVFTDSEVYAANVAECSNLAVGYLSQHKPSEVQDLAYAALLAERLVAADWSKLVVARNPADCYDRWPIYACGAFDPEDELAEMIADNPEQIADLLRALGYDTGDVADYLGIRLPPLRAWEAL